MQKNTTPRPVRRTATSDSRRRTTGANGTAHRREGSLRREAAAGIASPRRKVRREAAAITIESDTDTSVEEIEMADFQGNSAATGRRVRARQERPLDTIAAILWPLRIILQLLCNTVSLTISVFSGLLSPLLAQILLPVIGVALAIICIFTAVNYGLPYLFRAILSLIKAPFTLAWSFYAGKINLGDIRIGETLKNIGNGLPSGMAVTQGICSIAPVPVLCNFGLFDKMRALQEQDRAIVARKLQKEGQDALDIFDSVIKLGTGGADGGLHHTKIWELATAIKVSSNLAEKFEIAYEMRQLGDLSRDLSDEISVLAAESNSVFAWTVREFDRLFHTLTDDHSGLTPKELDDRVHRVMVRIQANLDNLYRITERTIPKAEAGSALGGRIIESVSWEVDRLEKGIKAEPGWKHSWEQAQRFIRGEHEPSKLDVLHNDLALSKLTVQNLQEIRLNLEIIRKHLRSHRNEVGLFSSGLMGFHLGFPSREENEPASAAKIELNMLQEIVSEMKGALAATKQHRKGQAQLELD